MNEYLAGFSFGGKHDNKSATGVFPFRKEHERESVTGVAGLYRIRAVWIFPVPDIPVKVA